MKFVHKPQLLEHPLAGLGEAELAVAHKELHHRHNQSYRIPEQMACIATEDQKKTENKSPLTLQEQPTASTIEKYKNVPVCT